MINLLGIKLFGLWAFLSNLAVEGLILSRGALRYFEIEGIQLAYLLLECTMFYDNEPVFSRSAYSEDITYVFGLILRVEPPIKQQL